MKFQAGIFCILSMASIMQALPLDERQNSCLSSPDTGISLINTIFDDVSMVNKFINNSFQPLPDFSLLNALDFELDESNQLSELKTLCSPNDGADGAIFTEAVNAASQGISEILGALQNLNQGIAPDIDSVSNALCRIVLPNLNKVTAIAAITLGVTDKIKGVVLDRPDPCTFLDN